MVNTSIYIADQIISSLQEALGDKHVVLHEPTFIGNEWKYVKECLDSTFVSSVGKYVDEFEYKIAEFTGAKHAIAVVNGTAGLHIALKLAGVIPNDEVLIPALTFVATANAVSYCNAIPHFVDSCEPTLGIDASKLRVYLNTITEVRNGECINKETGRVIRSLLPMHTFGHPADLDGCISIAHDFHLTIVEDAAESLGSNYHDKHTGTFGKVGVLSFNGNKIITTGGGGAILTNDSELAKKAKHLTTTAKIMHPWEYDHDKIGYNYRLPNLNAALGCAQLEQLPGLLEKKRKLFECYESVFADKENMKLIAEPSGCKSNYWLQTLLLDIDNEAQRNIILKSVNESGYMARPAWKLMDELKPYRSFPKMNLDNARSLSRRLINIPSSPTLIS